MPRYRVRGVYTMTFEIEVDETVEAENEELAFIEAAERRSAGECMEPHTEWEAGPEVIQLDDSE